MCFWKKKKVKEIPKLIDVEIQRLTGRPLLIKDAQRIKTSEDGHWLEVWSENDENTIWFPREQIKHIKAKFQSD